MDDVHYSSECMDWNTPQPIVDGLNAMGGVDLDPCSNEGSIVGAAVNWRLSAVALARMGLVDRVRGILGRALKARDKARASEAREILKRCRVELSRVLADPVLTPRNGLRDPWCAPVRPSTGMGHTLYGDRELVYVNPPYGDALPLWSQKITAEARAGLEIVALVPARTDTAWFNTLYSACSDLLLWRGRLTFLGAKHPAPFPSAVFYFGVRSRATVSFEAAFAGKGIFTQ